MQAKFARRIAWFLVFAYVILATVGLTLQVITGHSYSNIPFPILISMVAVAGAWPVTGALIISRHPRHPVGWLLSLGIMGASFDMFAAGYVLYDIFAYPGSLPGISLPLVWLNWSAMPFATSAFSLMILTFPTGHLPSPAWRKVVVAAILTLLVYLPLQAMKPGPADPFTGIYLSSPLGVSDSLWAVLEPFLWISYAMLALCNLLAISSLFIRLRRARGDERQQIKWLFFPAGLYCLTIPVLLIAMGTSNDLILRIGIALGLPAIASLVMAVAFAIFKYRLYDVDFLINRTLVYSALTGSIIALYTLTVGAFGTLFQSGGNLIVALVATGIVAVLFQPLRARLQRGVNRMMYGERDEPFTVLRQLGERLESSGVPEDVLTAIVETLCQALKLPYAEISLRRGDEFVRAAWYGEEPNGEVPFPIQYQGQTVGYLNVARRGPGEALSEADDGLLHQIAQQAGPVAQAVQLTRELRRSRARLVTAREEERRRLRRDLHDGLGPVMASQGLKIAAVSHLLDTDPEAARKLLDELASQNEATVAEIRRLVYALRPPELDELGLSGAIRDHTAGLDTSVPNGTKFEINVHPAEGDLAELPAAVEVAAYRIATEALTNVTRHAQARHCTINLDLEANGNEKLLRMEIKDDGIGLPQDRKAGVGMNSMRERAEEAWGELHIESAPQQGTRIVASFSLAE